jgi:hypothetical protein
MADGTQTVEVADVLAVDATIQASSAAAGYGLLPSGFVPKPFARILAEKLALSQTLFGGNVDLTSGSAIRKLVEVSALEDARTWSALGAVYDSLFVSSAVGDALSRLGRELGLPRPFMEARGTVKLKLVGTLPAGTTQIAIARGARLSSAGGHHVAIDESVVLSPAVKERNVAVVAFYPGPEHNLNPALPGGFGAFPQKLDRWNRLDPALEPLVKAEEAASANLVIIEHTTALAGGELQWPDARYRELLLRAPRSIWTIGSIETAVSLVPGVRQAVVRDPMGGLDINQSIFGNFNFIERLFGTERDLASPYYFTVLVAPTLSAIWSGPDGLQASVENAIEDLRPIGIFPEIKLADQVGVGIRAQLVTSGIPLPTGSKAKVNASKAAEEFKRRLLDRVGRYIDGLRFGEPVRASEIVWAMMNEPGLADVLNLQLLRFPAGFDAIQFTAAVPPGTQVLAKNENLTLQTQQIAVFVDEPGGLEII